MAEAGSRIGIDLGGTKIHGVVLRADGSIADEIRLPTPKHDYPATLAALASVALRLDPDGRLPVGVGTPGSPLPGEGRMHNCNSTWLNDRPLLADLRTRLGDRVRIANDADCFALSEAHGGAADGADSVFGVILGTGVGGGIVIHGRLLEGASGLAGEWGHNPLPQHPGLLPDALESRLVSRRCYCGRLNCVETFLSGPGLALTHEQLWGTGIDAERLYRLAVEGPAESEDAGLDWPPADAAPTTVPAQARLTLTLYCRMLASALAGVVNILDPAVIVLGGGLSQMSAIYQPLQRQLGELVFGGFCRASIRPPLHGDSSGVRGAAWLWPV